MDKKGLGHTPVMSYRNLSTYATRHSHSIANAAADYEKRNHAVVKAQEYHQGCLDSKRNTHSTAALHNREHDFATNNAKIKAITGQNTTPMEQLQAAHGKVTAIRSKNEEAIYDLRTRIPEIENIFDIHNRIGNGTFSTVLLATLKKDRDFPEHLKRKFAIKHHIPTSHPDRIMKELECMAKIGGVDNVVGINCCLRYNESVAFIMPYLAHDRFHDFFQKMDVSEVQFYMKNLLIALRHVHRFNVIHRDVKPSNFLYNRKRKQFLLVDFGLAQQVPQRLVDQQQQQQQQQVQNQQQQQICPQNQQQSEQRQQQQETNNNTNNEKNSQKRPREDASRKDNGNGLVRGGADGYADNEGEKIKRMKLSGSEQQQNQQQQQNNESSSVFKMPLKQINEIHPNADGSGSNGVVKTKAAATVEGSNPNGRAAGGASSATNQSITPQTTNPNNNPNNNNNVALNTEAINNSNAINKYITNRNLINNQNVKCNCYGNPQVCNICLVKKEVHASRAGTPGYRPPEVLLKFPDQTTAVDIWAAGVIFLSILSSVYPFFKAPNDYMALAEMVTIFGDRAIRKTAFVLDRLVTLSQKAKPLDLRKLCVRFRNRTKFSSPEMLRKYQKPDGSCEVCSNCDQYFYNCLCAETQYKTEPYEDDDIFPPSAYDLLYRLLEVNPHKRITAEEALQHPFITETYYGHGATATKQLPAIPKKIAASVKCHNQIGRK